jgi:hypothetical protein
MAFIDVGFLEPAMLAAALFFEPCNLLTDAGRAGPELECGRLSRCKLPQAGHEPARAYGAVTIQSRLRPRCFTSSFFSYATATAVASKIVCVPQSTSPAVRLVRRRHFSAVPGRGAACALQELAARRQWFAERLAQPCARPMLLLLPMDCDSKLHSPSQAGA